MPVSGYIANPHHDFSLLDELQGGKVLVVGDFTTILCQPDKEVRDFIGKLRSAFDGKFDHHSGNRGNKEYLTRFGLVVCCTGVLDRWVQENQELGERVLVCRLFRGHSFTRRRSVALRVSQVDGTAKSAFRNTYQAAVHRFLDDRIAFLQSQPAEFRVTRPPHLAERLALLAHLLVELRTVPDGWAPNDAEGPGRVAGQLASLLDSHALVQGRTTWIDSDL